MSIERDLKRQGRRKDRYLKEVLRFQNKIKFLSDSS
jgi:hypothetical protein